MDATTENVHRELLLPTPTEEPPEMPPLVWTSLAPFWLEIHREPAGRVRYALGSPQATDLESMLIYLENTRHRVAAGSPIACPLADLTTRGIFVRAVAVQRHHHLPLRIPQDADAAGFLLRTLGSQTLQDHDVVLQLLFQRARVWESGLFSARYMSYAERHGRALRAEMDARRAEPAYHVELRAHLMGPQPDQSLIALGAWLEQWTTLGGVPWRTWKVIPRKKEQPFHTAFATHDFARFSNRRGRRDVSATELGHLLSIPWATYHPECSYAGAPRGRAGRESLVSRSPVAPQLPTVRVLRYHPDPEPSPRPQFILGAYDGRHVALPPEWNHAALLGRTQSGKSTLALNLVLQILAKQPDATVVVVEPTGTLVGGIESRLSPEIASETIEIDPAHATFQEDGTTMVSVPLNLLRQPDPVDDEESDTERDRWAEALAGDLLAAIRSAWGEESIGGRAELVLRALVQGLSQTPGSNLVDAYHLLSSKPALQRFIRTAPPGPLRDFLERHLPRLDYQFTMSSLDKVGKIATNPLLRVALCQRSGAVSFDRLLRHRLLLLNLSKSALGAEGANFLGAVYLSQLWAAVQRSGRPDHSVYLVLDEVHNYAIPALADMLSEGAKFGLHVVVATQFLHRVPPRVRAALLGNVDAWLLFSLGVEDMDDAWKIVNGQTHGWTPQDLVDGLRPHEVALAVSGGLVKLTTDPSPPLGPLATENHRTVTESSRRYAQREDSEASPWLVGPEVVQGVMAGLSTGPRTREELEDSTMLPGAQLDGALALAASEGDVEPNEDAGRLRLTSRGQVHLAALEGRRNEGEEHIETLTEFAVFLEKRGIALSVPKQVAGILTPDGQFQWGSATYNVEVECSTVAKAAGQVIRNVKKARAAGHRVLIVLPDRSAVPRTLALVEDGFPGLSLWADGVGLVWKEGRAAFRPFATPGIQVWPFLSGSGAVEAEVADRPPLPVVETDPLVSQVREVVSALLVAGRAESTPQEVLALLRASERGTYSEQQVGTALRSLGLDRRRSRLEGTRFRVYDLRPAGPISDAAVPMGPSHPKSAQPESQGGTEGRASSSPRENGAPGPADTAVPDD
ncbi:MAG TPA: hypothetical protein VK424_01915 [Thermoplasmata archaeon]|nr:hypothetical protein [Thermoplasmata archaeon]